MNAFRAVCHKGFSAENSARKGIQYAYMLGIFTVQDNFPFMAGRLLEAFRCLEAVLALAYFQFVQGQFIVFRYQLAFSRVTSRRLVPGASAVVVTNTPVAPLGNSR